MSYMIRTVKQKRPRKQRICSVRLNTKILAPRDVPVAVDRPYSKAPLPM